MNKNCFSVREEKDTDGSNAGISVMYIINTTGKHGGRF